MTVATLSPPAWSARLGTMAGLLDALPQAVVLSDPDGRCWLNAAARQLLPVLPTGRGEQRLEGVFGPDHPLVSMAARAQLSGTVRARDLALYEGAGRRTIYDAACEHLPEERLTVTTLWPAAQGRVENDPALAGEVLRGVAQRFAHEVRNPLAGIRGAAQLLMRTADPSASALAQLVRDEADRIERLTERLEALEMLQRPQCAPTNIHVATGRVVDLLRAGYPTIRVHAEFDPSLPELWVDRDQIIQAVLNLGKNAAEACGEGGRVTIGTRFLAGRHLQRRPDADRVGLVEVSVTDDGPGIDEGRRALLFRPFISSKAGGMGLGLTITAEIVKRHDGLIEVQTCPGRTRFAILLPLRSENEAGR